MPAVVALIPARAGSTRVPGKNLRELGGHPLLAYAIGGAREADIFEQIVVSTDDEATAEVARNYGADVPGLRPAQLAGPKSPDIEWVRFTLDGLMAKGRMPDAFSILRPTSPFRRGHTIRRAWDRLTAAEPAADSIRAVELCREHPGKMWVLEGETMRPLLPQPPAAVPHHSSQYQALPTVYVQNSSLEIAWCRVPLEAGDIAGRRVLPFFTEGAEGMTIDYPDDWARAEKLVLDGVDLPPTS